MTNTTPEPTEGSDVDLDAIFGPEAEAEHEQALADYAEEARTYEYTGDLPIPPPVENPGPIENIDELAVPDLTEQERTDFLEAIQGDDGKITARVIYSTVNDGLGNEQVIGWDTCGKCMHHIQVCSCVGGPHRPTYIEKFAFKPEPARLVIKYDDGGDMVDDTMHASAVTEAEWDEAPAEATSEATSEAVSSGGRRKRKDAGVKRGPRKPSNPEATRAAAEDLSNAIKAQVSDGSG